MLWGYLAQAPGLRGPGWLLACQSFCMAYLVALTLCDNAMLLLGFEGRDPVPHVGRLELYEDGFVVADGGLAPLVVSFARQDCAKIAVVQVSKDAHGVAMELKDPSHLRAGSIVDASYAVLVVRKHAPARRAVDGSLERWRRHCSREDAHELVKQAQESAARCWTEEALGLSRGLSDVQDAKVEALIDEYAERSGSRVIDRLFGASSNDAPSVKGPPAYLENRAAAARGEVAHARRARQDLQARRG